MRVLKKEPAKTFQESWIGEAIEAVVGKELSRFRYYKASKKDGTRTIDKLVLYFSNGYLSISPDLVGKELELVVWFTPKSK
jgi:hypothetical protein